MGTPIHIALVDDEKSLHTLYQIAFKQETEKNLYHMHYFLDGKQCVDFLNEKKGEIKIILILTDINMPRLDGFELIEIVKRDFPDTIVYVLSAYGSQEYKEKASDLGAQDYLVKPINFRSLKARIYDTVKHYF
jgi:DNA-binding response OmpR family regulator